MLLLYSLILSYIPPNGRSLARINYEFLMNGKNKSLGLNPKLLLGCHQDSFLFLALMRLAQWLFFILAFTGGD